MLENQKLERRGAVQTVSQWEQVLLQRRESKHQEMTKLKCKLLNNNTSARKYHSPGAPNNPVAAGAGAPKMEVPGAGVGAAVPIAKETTHH